MLAKLAQTPSRRCTASGIRKVAKPLISRVLFIPSSLLEFSYLNPPAASAIRGSGPLRSRNIPSPCTFSGVYLARASRLCWCALTAPLHPYRQAGGLHFCGTILTLSRTGRYPATSPAVPGLSSSSCEDATVCETSHCKLYRCLKLSAYADFSFGHLALLRNLI
jgi:hypothetical protein